MPYHMRHVGTGLDGPLCPVRSMDQLYVQAACLEPLLLHKVQEWAAVSGGYFPCKAAGGGAAYVRYTHDSLKGPGGPEFQWCKLKAASRAMEKVVRSYGEDASRLVDVCRQAVVFDTLRDVRACLAAMTADTEVELVRVKNRCDPGYDAALLSAGYRDVNVNLRLRCKAAQRLGVDLHVCEVLLLLRGIAEVKSEEGHANYVASRNLRAE